MLANENKVAGKITWAGFRGDEKFSMLHEHDLLVLPSHDENFGNVVIESLSQGTAVLISPFVGLRDYVAKNNFGWECGLSPTEIAETIDLIYGKRDELNYIRDIAPKVIRSDFNESKLAARYINMYDDIING